MNVNQYISALAKYGIDRGLIDACDRTWAINQLIDALGLHSYEDAEPADAPLEEILKALLDDAVARGICAPDVTSRDLLDTKLMGLLTPPPHEVRAKFAGLYEKSPARPRTGTTNFPRTPTTSAAIASKRTCAGWQTPSMATW